MRRILLALPLIWSIALSTATTHAATIKPVHLVGLAGSIQRVLPAELRSPSLAGHTARAVHVESRISNAPPQQSASGLFLPDSAFAPAMMNSQFDGVIAASDADQLWFRNNHSTTYESLGFVTGVYQRADWNKDGATVSFRHQGSVMSSASSASNAYTDGVNYVQTNYQGSPTSCSSSGLQCTALVDTYTDTSTNTSWKEVYYVMQYQQCLAEIAGDAPASVASSQANQIVQTTTNLATAAVTAMGNTCGSTGPTPTPTPTGTTSFSVISVRFEKAGSKPDFNLTKPPVTALKTGAKIRLAMYIAINSLPASTATVNMEFILKRNGATVLDKKFVNDGINADTWRFYPPKDYKVTKAGNYTLQAGAEINGKTDGDSATLTATKKYKAPKKVSFHLNSVTLLNKNNQAQTHFHAGDGFQVQVDYSVKNLKGAAPIVYTVSFVNPSSGRAFIQHPYISRGTVRNGHSQQSFPFIVPHSFGSQIKMQAGVTVGSSGTQSGSAMLSIG